MFFSIYALMFSVAQVLRRAVMMDNLPNLVLPKTNDMRSTKAAFIKEYVKVLTEKENKSVSEGDGAGSAKMLTGAEKYKEGVEAWMHSTIRATLCSGKDTGFSAIPCSMILG